MSVLQLLLGVRNRVNFLIPVYMTPYHCPTAPGLGKSILLVTLVIALGVNPAWGGSGATASASDALTKSGFEHFYSLEYDQAIQDFQKVVDANPDDPKALNHLIESILFRELYKYDALDTSLYTHESFLNSKQIPLDAKFKNQIIQLTDKALALSEKRLRSNRNDVEALYVQGTTKGLRSTYLALAEHSWFAALRSALSARGDHEQVLRLRPSYVDAKTLVGAHNYVVGSLSTPVKVLVGVTGIHGDKNKGLEYLFEAAKAGGESSADARVALGLFLRREQRFQDAINVVHVLVQDHPRNFLFALEEANLMKDAGKGPDAVNALRALLNRCKEGKYPGAHVELGQYAFAEALRGQNQLQEAFAAYSSAANSNSINQELRQRAFVAAGQVSDLLTRREEAVKQYRAALALDSSTNEAEIARHYLSRPYKGR
jgi:tetratricopeptide (TPR) repeat protein